MRIPHRFTHPFRLVAAATMSVFLLAACGPSPAPAPAPAPEPAAVQDSAGVPGVEASPVPEPDAGSGAGMGAAGSSETVGGDGSPIALDRLDAEDIAAADLPGELACAFVDADGTPLLHAAGMVASDDPALGIVKLSGFVETVRAPGGFDGMLDDPTFSARGMTVRIRTTGAATGGGESPPRPATMTLLRADGASRGIDGRWECGP